MNFEIPKFQDTFTPILEILKERQVFATRELINTVIESNYSHLSEELLSQKTKSGEILINNRIAWGKSYLKKGGYIEFPKRGFVKITEKGLQNIKNVSLSKINSEVDLTDFFSKESTKKGIEKIENASPQDLIDEGFREIESEIKSELLQKLREIDPYYFEKVILILLKKMGYGDFIETSKSGDGGIDGIINEDKLGLDKIYIQAKRFTENKVREKDIRNFIGAMSGDTNKGVFCYHFIVRSWSS